MRRSVNRWPQRFIPTLVGNARTPRRTSHWLSVHPHARGERHRAVQAARSDPGSSPRSWGTRLRSTARTLEGRFIPTLVGNANRRPSTTSSPTVHPHARGERSLRTSGSVHSVGSSPRSWGTPAARACRCRPGRFIPTLVGNASAASAPKVGAAVHPHARGERSQFPVVAQRQVGSSPRSWGTRRRSLPRARRGRFIPTLVGNACRDRCLRCSKPVHPHARGERHRLADPLLAMFGSSPRSWGTPRVSESSLC